MSTKAPLHLDPLANIRHIRHAQLEAAQMLDVAHFYPSLYPSFTRHASVMALNLPVILTSNLKRK